VETERLAVLEVAVRDKYMVVVAKDMSLQGALVVVVLFVSYGVEIVRSQAH
jgi:hypothetical protein